MNPDILIAFAIGRIILSGTPGPGVIASISISLSEGFRKSIHFLNGIVFCNIIFFLAAIFGITALSGILGKLFFSVKIAGGVYMIYLGLKFYYNKIDIIDQSSQNYKTNFSTFFGGFLLTLANPAPILFYASIVPLIIKHQKIESIQIIILVLIIVIIAYLVTGSYCYIASLTKNLLTSKRVLKIINKSAGVIVSITGIYILIK